MRHFLWESNCPILIQAKEHLIPAVVLRVCGGGRCHLALFGVPTQGSERRRRRGKGGGGGWPAGLPLEITAFESKAHAKKDYFHVGKRGEMAATAQRALGRHRSGGRPARAVCRWEEGGSHPNNLKRQRQTGRNTTAALSDGAVNWGI